MLQQHHRLITLGRVALLSPDGAEETSLAGRPLKLALLAVLAVSRTPRTRDSLIEMFWGERDETRARHSLADALSHLRRMLGRDAISVRQAEVVLTDSARLTVDALELVDAVAAHDYARAVSLYQGPFLAGVYLADSSSFEHWVDRERQRLEALWVTAVREHSAALAREKRWDETAALAARWLDADPASKDAAVLLLDALTAPSTSQADVKALAAYGRYKERLARELDLPPDPAVAARAEQISARVARLRAVVPPKVQPPDVPVRSGPRRLMPPDMPARSGPRRLMPPAVAPRVPSPQASAPAGPSPQRLTRRAMLIAATVILASVGSVIAAITVRGEDPHTATPLRPAVAIAWIRSTRPDTSAAWIGEGLTQMMAAKLARSPDVEIIPPQRMRDLRARAQSGGQPARSVAQQLELARLVGATWIASGALTQGDTIMLLEVSVYETPSGKLLRLFTVSGRDMLTVADAAAARLLETVGADTRTVRLQDVETANIEASEHFARGLDAMNAGRRAEGMRQLDQAIALDSGFMSAVHYRLLRAAEDAEWSTVDRLTAVSRKYVHRATEFDRLELETLTAYRSGAHARSELLARRLVERFPRDPRSYARLADILAHHGRFEDAERVYRDAIALDSLGIESGRGACAPCVGYSGLTATRVMRGDIAGALQTARRWVDLQPDLPSAWRVLASTLHAAKDSAGALKAIRRAIVLLPEEPEHHLDVGRLLIANRQFTAVDSVIRVLAASASAPMREGAVDLRMMLQRERGQFRASTQNDGLLLVRANSAARAGDYARAQHMYESQTQHAAVDPQHMFIPVEGSAQYARAFAWHHALLADAMAPVADTTYLMALADSIEQIGAHSHYARDWRVHHHVRGLVAMRAGRYEQAVHEFRAAMFGVAGWTRTNAALADAYLALGRPADAIATLRLVYLGLPNIMARYLPWSEVDYRMALAFRAAGMRDSVAVYSDYARRAWRDADPEVKRLLENLR